MIFNLIEKDVVSITGAGGKTSLMFYLANKLKGKVLVTTSTKIYKSNNKVCFDKEEIPSADGYYLYAKKEENKKLSGFNRDDLLEIVKNFNYTLIEADGSKEKPLKGWSEKEPVIHNFSNVTIGVLNINAVFSSLNQVFRLEELKKITNIYDKIEIDNLKDIVLNENGLFKNSVNRKILFINQVETVVSENNAQKLYQKLTEDERFDLDQIVIGSIHNNRFKTIYSKKSIVVLASGLSKRMASYKMLEKFKGKPLVEHILSKLRNYPASKYLIVKDRELDQLASKYYFETVLNKNNSSGISESLKLAVAEVDADNYSFFLGDMPFLTADTIRAIINNNNQITYVSCGDLISAPVSFNRKYKAEIMLLEGDVGAKKIVQKHFDKAVKVLVDKRELIDIDTQEEIDKYEGLK